MLKGIFLPYMVTSHIIPLVDIGRIFAMHGVDVTIIATPVNAAIFQSSIDRDSSLGRSIRTLILKFPHVAGLPEGIENINSSTPVAMFPKIMEGVTILQGQFEQLFRDIKPDFIVSDMFYPWSANAATELGIPRLVYMGSSYFSHCASNSIEEFSPHTKVNSDSESFLLPGLPHKLEMTRSQLPDWVREPNLYTNLLKMIRESEKKSYGSLFKSFYEFDRGYEEYYNAVTGTKSWSLGPVSLWVNQDDSDETCNGHAKEEKQEKDDCLTWLDSKKENSVLYVSFGSMNKFLATQLVEIAHALEDSGYDFIWVVRKVDDNVLEEFEKRVRESNKGYLIWGWAPQVQILEHPATGAVVTHCGMNTVFESVNASLPMVAWPIFAEQFFNEKLLVDVLKIGVAVGAKEWRNLHGTAKEVLKREDIGKAIAKVMDGGEECLEMRKRVKVLSDAAKKAIQVGGSSYNNMKNLIEDLKSIKLQKEAAA
ncbi:soyasapogenol B glucuronide galactosyltransferase-like [Abrus precatorius]|uniref:Glycosyltransferase n=1 Tax=Abrus precatorius TaxID=3816 RepID=A0A8B8KAW7_ABRPR|nr:soyasapogenol B glucuronide galactosyltransferase-like [Abrus precatorius]